MKQILIIVLIGLTITSCKNNSIKQVESISTSNKVTVGYLNMVSSLTHFVALEKGYYTEQNLEVRGNSIKTSDLIAQDLVAGHINVGIELAITPVLKQLEIAPNSIKIFSTSNITTDNGFDAILVNNSSLIRKLEDLSGKKVGGFPGTTAKVSFLELFKTKHPKLPPPEFIKLSPDQHIQSLLIGDIDALFAYEPILSTGMIKYNFREIFPSVYGAQFSPNPIGVGAVNQQWLKENHEIAKAFFIAIDKAV
ncbi:MAG: ABC transporter substrate-binding protein, partial [Bacteroidota bacterium]